MATRKASLPTKKHVLAVSVKLMLAQGYRNTTVKEIAGAADVSVSSVQNFFGNKEGILTELVRMMFDGLFAATRQNAPGIYTYAAEAAVQLVLTDRNDYLREIYIEAYTLPDTMEFIRQNMTMELKSIFGDRFPDYEESDFYEMEIGSSAVMRGYMAKPSDMHFPLRRKIDGFLITALRMYCVSEEEIRKAIDFVHSLELNQLADNVVRQLFDTMETYYEENVLRPTKAARSKK